MRHTLPLFGLVLALLLTGCAATSDRSGFAPGEPLGVAFSRSGGLAGGSSSLIITTDGDFTIERDGRRVRRGSLTDGQRSALDRHVRAVPWDRVEERYDDERGRDTHAYLLSVTSASGEMRGVSATDASASRAPAALRELLHHLSGLLDDLSPR